MASAERAGAETATAERPGAAREGCPGVRLIESAVPTSQDASTSWAFDPSETSPAAVGLTCKILEECGLLDDATRRSRAGCGDQAVGLSAGRDVLSEGSGGRGSLRGSGWTCAERARPHRLDAIDDYQPWAGRVVRVEHPSFNDRYRSNVPFVSLL
jgi:hypothetical protein